MIELQGNTAAASVVVKDNQPLLIVLPITVFIIAILMVLVCVLVCYVLMMKGTKRNASKPDVNSGYSHLEMTLQSTTTSLSREQSIIVNSERAEHTITDR